MAAAPGVRRAAHDHVVAVRNDANLGFTATVNRGCALAPGDVVLLNSDTEVTADWLEKLSACAASSSNVATVPALSNAAGAFSLPVNNTDNDIPPPLNCDDIASLVERLSQWVRPEVPTGNGFCMYVTRRGAAGSGVVRRGAFPARLRRGERLLPPVRAKGMVNLVDDRTFIRHKGTASFLGTKAVHAARGLEAMRRFHPDYDALVQRWLRNDPLDALRARSATRWRTSARRRRTPPGVASCLSSTTGAAGRSTWSRTSPAQSNTTCAA